METISVVIPIYNVEKYLSRCLESIINQTYKNLEIILIDDGSPDNSGKICDEYAEKDNRITVIHKENGGVSSARNIGLEHATGDYITFVDSDDWLEIDAYENMLEQIKLNGVDLVKCGFYKDFSDGKIIEKNFIFPNDIKLDMKSKREDVLEMFTTGKVDAGICYILVKKECIKKIEKFNTDIALGEDLLFEIELMCNINSVYMYNKRYYHYYTNIASATYSPRYRKRNILALLNLNTEVFRILKKYDLLTKNMLDGFNFYCFYNIYINLIKVVKETNEKELISNLISDNTMNSIVIGISNLKLSVANKMFVSMFMKKNIKQLYYYCWLIGTLKGIKKI